MKTLAPINTGKLFISFWDICLDNLPEGAFRHRRITPDEARLSIAQARHENKLLCVSDDDIGAPYKKREAQNHEALCRVLGSHLGIALSLADLFSKHDDENDGLSFVNSLNCVQVHDHSRLLVVTCAYVPAKDKTPAGPPAFHIDPETVEFHIIETI